MLLIILVILIYCLFFIENEKVKKGKEKTTYYHVLFKLHIICSILLLLFATLHGIGHLTTAPLPNLITGLTGLLLIYSQVIIGILINKPNTRNVETLKKIHSIIPIILVIVIICHLLLIK